MVIKAQIELSGDPGKMFRLEHHLKDAIRSQNIPGIKTKVNKAKRIISVDGEISQEQLTTILSTCEVKYDSLRYEPVGGKEMKTDSKVVYPEDYWIIKDQIKKQSETIGLHEGKISQLEEELEGEQTKRRTEVASLHTRLKDSAARYSQALNVQDFLSDMMARESQTWENFVKSYTQSLKDDSQLFGIPLGVLEKECLDYVELRDRPEVKKIEKDVKNANEAKKAADKNPLLALNDYAQKVLDKHARMTERDGMFRQVRAELMGYAKDKSMRIAVTTHEDQTLVTLPFKVKEGHGALEKGLAGAIESSLTTSKTEFAREEFNGLLRYRIPEMKKGARNKLLKEICGFEDAFTKLGGTREIVSFDVYKSD